MNAAPWAKPVESWALKIESAGNASATMISGGLVFMFLVSFLCCKFAGDFLSGGHRFFQFQNFSILLPELEWMRFRKAMLLSLVTMVFVVIEGCDSLQLQSVKLLRLRRVNRVGEQEIAARIKCVARHGQQSINGAATFVEPSTT